MIRDSKGQFVKGENIKDLTGEKFGKLTVVKLGERRSGRKTYWECICDCGMVKEVRSDALPRINSCGCVKKEQDKINLTGHYMHMDSGTRLYEIWQSLKGRCSNETNTKYLDYGGRGISVCYEWAESYEVFKEWAIEQGYSSAMTIERINNDGNYEPDNCKWIPFSEQANNRRSTVWITHQGRTQNLKQWCNELGLPYGSIHSRYTRGKRAPELFEPIRTQYRGKA